MKKIYLSLFTIVVSLGTSIAQGPPIVLAWDLANNGDYAFTSWSSAAQPGTYPPAILFKQYTTTATEPTATSDPTETWRCYYNFTARCRIVGRGDSGVVFINTSNPQTDLQCDGVDANSIQGKKVGAALLNLITTGREAITVSFVAGTYQQTDSATSPRIFDLLLEGRPDSTSAWVSIPGGLYTSAGAIANTTQAFSNIVLPANFDNKPLVQLRWKYYQSTAGAGIRPGLSLDNINVTSSIYTGSNQVFSYLASLSVSPNPASSLVNFNKEIGGTLLDISGKTVANFSKTKSLSLNGIAAGLYTLRSSDGEVVKISVE